jgi:hypothetical protein
MLTSLFGKRAANAVITRDSKITDHGDLLIFSTTGGHTTLSMVLLKENAGPPDVTLYDGYCSESEMDSKLCYALIFLLDAFGCEMSHHTKIKADVPSQIGTTNCGPLACIPFIQQLTGERLDPNRWNPVSCCLDEDQGRCAELDRHNELWTTRLYPIHTTAHRDLIQIAGIL